MRMNHTILQMFLLLQICVHHKDRKSFGVLREFYQGILLPDKLDLHTNRFVMLGINIGYKMSEIYEKQNTTIFLIYLTDYYNLSIYLSLICIILNIETL